MNIFALDDNPRAAAAMHCDKHVVKMVLETAQLMSTMVHALDAKNVFYAHVDGYDSPRPFYYINKEQHFPIYKPTHANHPCSLWLRESLQNAMWLAQLGEGLSEEHDIRYGHPSFKSISVIRNIFTVLARLPLPNGRRTPFALAMPKEIVLLNLDPVQSYRLYYASAKRGIAKWKTAPPAWWDETMRKADELNLPTTNLANDGVKE